MTTIELARFTAHPVAECAARFRRVAESGWPGHVEAVTAWTADTGADRR